MNDDEDEVPLSATQKERARRLARGDDEKTAAKVLGVAFLTVKHWQQLPGFQACWRAECEEIWRNTLAYAKSRFRVSVDVLLEVVQKGGSAKDRTEAAKVLSAMLLTNDEQAEVRKRMEDLAQKVNAAKKVRKADRR